MERETRLELATICLEGRGSSQLSYSRTLILVISLNNKEALPIHLYYMERETRLELATICLEGRGSSQLSYSRKTFMVGLEGLEPSTTRL